MSKIYLNIFNKLLAVLLLIIICSGSRAQHTPSAARNFIYSRTILKDNVKTPSDISALTAVDVRGEVQYFDGLGRPLQNVSVQAAPDGKDIVTPIAYDAFGRQDKSYLPYAASGTNSAYRASALTEQASFYTTPPTASIPAIPNPYSQTVFEASPLNRPLELGAPGTSWAIGNGHTVKTGYEINAAGEVRQWNIDNNGTVNTGATSPGHYSTGQLYKNVSEDEHQNKVIEYKDKEGQVVCKKVQDGADGNGPTYMVTQYIYDDVGQLAYVIPPALESITSFTELDTNFDYYIYGYHYDGRRRLIEKKIPGKSWEYIVYNAAGRPVLTSDGEQRNRGVWSYFKYDALGRIIITGEVVDGTTRESLQSYFSSQQKPNGSMELWEVYDNAQPFGYTNNTLPQYNTKVLSVNYYDDYYILTTASNPYPAWFTQPNGTASESQRTKGLPTVTATRILDSDSFLLAATYYTDDKARVSKLVKQHQLQGVDITTHTYNFVGEVTATTRQHYKDGNLALTVSNTYVYDHAGRKTQTTETINSQSPVTTAYTYNAVGQLETKAAGGQTTSYQYNARGWIKQQSSGLFTQELKYDDASGSYAQYNGNIGQQLWTTNGQSHSYHYTYDKANRLLSGISDENYNETMSYDKMGNIQSLVRQGTGVPGVGTLSYSYAGNRLLSVSGGYNRSYAHNFNGSTISDGTLNIQYNELNLPKQVTGTPVGTVAYIYNADGSKLTKQTVSETRQYIDGIEYIGVAIDLLHTETGVARNNGGTYTYEFLLTDHLGNTRIVHNSAGTVLQQQDYMPFGLDIARSQSVPNKYKYNDKEKQDELNQYDYGARFYDPVIGRWHVVDPLADKYFGVSPYTYVLNNPISLFDPDGRDAIITFTRDKDGNITAITITSTIYIQGGSDEERTNYIAAANKYLKNHNNFADAKSSVNLTFNVNYVDGGKNQKDGKSTHDLGEGENILAIGGGSVASGTWDKENGVYKTGVFGHIEKGLIDEELTGHRIFHESLHLLGLTDRYDEVGYKDTNGDGKLERQTKAHNGFVTDIMGNFIYGNLQKFSEVHRKNYKNYLENIINTKPELINQKNQSAPQFLLKYRVDLDRNKKLITPK